MKNIYESIELQHLKFTTKWVGALIAEVSDQIDEKITPIWTNCSIFNSNVLFDVTVSVMYRVMIQVMNACLLNKNNYGPDIFNLK